MISADFEIEYLSRKMENKELPSARRIPLYVLQDVPGKGKGLIATRPIPRALGFSVKSHLLLAPLARQIWDSRKRPCASRSRAFLANNSSPSSLCAISTRTRILTTNALPIEDDGVDGGVFLEASRINHACNNNAQKHWNERIKRHTIHAIRDIAIGEEITTTYLGTLRNRKMRQEKLQAIFSFRCLCGLCSLPEEQSKQVDSRLEQIFYLDQVIGLQGIEGISAKPLKMLRLIERQVNLYNEHGANDVGLSRAFLDASQVLLAHDDLARAKVFMQKAVSEWEAIEGHDSATVLEYRHLSQDPSKHKLHGISKKWATRVNQIPQRLDSRDFEDWLWRRDKPMSEGQLADFRHHAYFPEFAELPYDRGLDLDFYDFMDNNVRRPRRNWCFIGEVVDIGYLTRLQIEVQDRSGGKVPIFFHTEDRGEGLMASLKTGHIVAILYANSHAFMDGQFGIRHEDASLLKVFLAR